jgi:hypothetical protein
MRDYRVLVTYRDPRAGVWYGPQEDADAAHARYAAECERIARGGVLSVLLTRSGVIVAQATC